MNEILSYKNILYNKNCWYANITKYSKLYIENRNNVIIIQFTIKLN